VVGLVLLFFPVFVVLSTIELDDMSLLMNDRGLIEDELLFSDSGRVVVEGTLSFPLSALVAVLVSRLFWLFAMF
jgi:hypothetical protein